MNWTYLKNHEAKASTRTTTPPWQMVSPSGIPTGIDKTAFRKWCAEPTTDHVFFSTVEADNYNVRPSAGNDPLLVHGFVGDYDSDLLVSMTDQEVLDEIKKRTGGKGIMPNHMSRTFSNKIRLVWEFESPVPGDIPAALAKTIDLFVKDSKANQMLDEGLDKCSWDMTQFYEMGRGWVDLGNPVVPATKLQTLYFKAAASTVTKAETLTAIPMEDLEVEIDKQYPGALAGVKLGSGVRVPLFWIGDNNPTLDGQVGENGIWSYSTNREFGLKTWGSLLGKAFVKNYEEKQINDVVTNYYFDGRHYWRKLPNAEWHHHAKEDAIMHIENLGFSSKPDKSGRSPVKQMLVHMQDYRRIDGVAPFLFDKRELVSQQISKRYLNTNTRFPMEPAGLDGDLSRWPWLQYFLFGFFDKDPNVSTDPHDHFMAWLKRLWASARAGRMEQGHAILIAGDADEGKSLFSMFILRAIMGGGSDAGSYLISGGGFNQELGEVAIWNVDDQAAASDFSDHQRFSAMIKKTTANPEIKYHPKYANSITLRWAGRVVITCNKDTNSLDILPTLDASIKDKLMLFKLANRKPDFPPSAELESRILTELPHFLDWLEQWAPPDSVIKGARNRFGVVEYHHSEILREVRQKAQDECFKTLLVRWFKQRVIIDPELQEWRGQPSDLFMDMTNTAEDSMRILIQNKYSPEKIGKMLRMLKQAEDPIVVKYMNGRNRNRYVLRPSEEDLLDQDDSEE